MAYTFDAIFATDPNNAQNVAANAAITLFDPADTGKAPITITDVTGAALPNPITVNKNGFGPAFQHATLDRIGWHGGGFTGYFTSYEGIKAAAVAAQGIAATAQANAEAAQASAEEAAALVGAPADTAVETLINTPGSATAVALDTAIGELVAPKLDASTAAATYAPALSGRSPGNTAVAIGDSNTYPVVVGGTILSHRAADMWFNHLCVESNGRIRRIGQYATSGFTIEQIRDTHVPQVLALSPRPAACFVLAGTNNVGTTGYSATASKAAMGQIFDQLRAGGVQPIAVTLPPLPLSATYNKNVGEWNQWLSTLGLPVVPLWDALVDPVTGGFATGLESGDGIHLSRLGHKVVGQYAAASDIASVFPAGRPMTAKSVTDPANLVVNGIFNVDTDANGRADSWGGSAGVGHTPSLVAPVAADKIVGNWQKVVVDSTATTAEALTQTISTGFAVGDKLAFTGRIRTTGMDGTAARLVVYVNFTGSAGPHLEPIYGWGTDIADGLFYGEAVVPAGTTSLAVNVYMTARPASGSVSVQVAEVAVRKIIAG